MSDTFETLQTLNEYKGTWGAENGSKQVTVVAPSMTDAASVLNAEGEFVDPVIIQCIKTQIKVAMPSIYVSFVTEAVDTSGLAQSTCYAYPTQYTLLAGARQIFTAVPGAGFTFSKWLIDDEDALNVDGEAAVNPVEILEIPSKASVVTIKAVFDVSP